MSRWWCDVGAAATATLQEGSHHPDSGTAERLGLSLQVAWRPSAPGRYRIILGPPTQDYSSAGAMKTPSKKKPVAKNEDPPWRSRSAWHVRPYAAPRTRRLRWQTHGGQRRENGAHSLASREGPHADRHRLTALSSTPCSAQSPAARFWHPGMAAARLEHSPVLCSDRACQ